MILWILITKCIISENGDNENNHDENDDNNDERKDDDVNYKDEAVAAFLFAAKKLLLRYFICRKSLFAAK